MLCAQPGPWILDQLQKLASTPCDIEPQFLQAYFFACFTGLRWSDVNGLMWSNIIRRKVNKVEEWYIHFEQQKTEAVEYFPLSDQAVEILREQEIDQMAFIACWAMFFTEHLTNLIII